MIYELITGITLIIGILVFIISIKVFDEYDSELIFVSVCGLIIIMLC